MPLHKMKKILFTISNSDISGAEKQLLLLLENINKNLFHIEVCCLGGEGPFTKSVDKLGLKYFSYERKSSFDINRLFSLYKLIIQKDYDLIVSYCWSANQYSRIASLFAKKEHIACERGHDYMKNNLDNKLIKLLEPISNKIVFNSKIQMESYKKYIKNTPEKLFCIYNGVNIIPVKNSKLNDFYKTFNIDNGKKLIGTVGNFSETKNFNMFIKVCEKMIKDYNNILFIAIGEGPQKKYYEKIIYKKNLNEYIIMTGYLDKIYEVITLLDIFLLTSSCEGMPNVIMEAMAAKVPVISTSVDGCKELINNKKNGFLVDINDIDKMCSNVKILLEHDNVYRKIVNNAFEKISRNFSIGKMVKEYENILSQ